MFAISDIVSVQTILKRESFWAENNVKERRESAAEKIASVVCQRSHFVLFFFKKLCVFKNVNQLMF